MISYSLFKRIGRVLTEAVSMKPTFVQVIPDADSIESIVELAEMIGLSNSLLVAEDELHATVCYSRKEIKDPTKTVEDMLPIQAVGDELHFFKTKTGKDCLVLKLSSVSLRALHLAIKNGYGASHDFPTFEAHVTLCYGTPPDVKAYMEEHWIGEDLNVPVTFTKFEVKELDLDWKPSK